MGGGTGLDFALIRTDCQYPIRGDICLPPRRGGASPPPHWSGGSRRGGALTDRPSGTTRIVWVLGDHRKSLAPLRSPAIVGETHTSDEDITLGAVELSADDLKSLWEKIVARIKAPEAGYRLETPSLTVSCSFKDPSGRERRVSVGSLEELLSHSEVPDTVYDLTLRGYVQLEPERRGDEYQSRTISVTIWTASAEVHLNISGSIDWNGAVKDQLIAIIERHPRRVLGWRIFLTFGISVPVFALLLLGAAYISNTDAADAIVGVAGGWLFGGSAGLLLWTDTLLPPSRVSLRGAPSDPTILRVAKDLVYLIISGVIIAAVLSYFGVPH